MEYVNVFINGYKGYAGYLWREITNPHIHNYFYWLILISLFFLALEWMKPWRENQSRFRKDFWLDFFYMFFNFFLFSLIIYAAVSDVIVVIFNNAIKSISGGFDLQASNPMRHLPYWGVLLIGFLVRDFVQWWTHRLLHYSERLWEFHKVHHSVEEMGFAAHLRYHWMETIVYRTMEYIPLALLGIGLYDFFIIHIFTLAVGHYNHSNITVSKYVTGGILGGLIGICIGFSLFQISLFPAATFVMKLGVVLAGIILGVILLGPIMKKLFNHPEMHIWHHAYEIPEERRKGVNFGLSLAIWDFIFGTAYIPYDGKNIKLGFPKVETFPNHFKDQFLYGFKKRPN